MYTCNPCDESKMEDLYHSVLFLSYIAFFLFSLLLTRNELDNPHKKKTWKTFRFNFSVELNFLPCGMA